MKKYELLITEEGNRINVSSTNEGFNPYELVGLLETKKYDILKQIWGGVKPDIQRIVTKKD